MEGKGPKWDVKVTSKGQVTLPKEAREALLVREGDHLEAVLQDDTIILRRRDEVPESEKVRAFFASSLREAGIDPDKPHPELDAPTVRRKWPALPFEFTERIRAQREGREEP